MRSTHPLILAINKRDSDLRKAGKQAGLWSADEVAALFECGRNLIYRLRDASKLEFTHLGTGNTMKGRFTSATLIAFILLNTTGPDEVVICDNLEKLIRTLSLDALNHLSDYIQSRQHLISGGEKPAPRKIRRLADALDPNAPAPTPQDSETPDLFANLTLNPATPNP